MIQHWRNFLDGMGRALLLSDDRDYVIPKKGDSRHDFARIVGDMRQVGNDMRRALKKAEGR